MVTKLITKFLLLTFVCGLSLACGRENNNNDVQTIFTTDSKVELLFFFKKDSSTEARDNFYENILNQPHPRGGYIPREGIQATFGVDRNGYEGFGFKFRNDATSKQRNDIKKLLEDSALVYRVYENVAPNEINDL